ncbi:MAG: amidohydrolase family protein, partial [Ilumatobacter sp.]|nr:amidohydrolase family protein [Ilumatobacter sp.]
FYWGEAHAAMTIGEERAAGMDACATALRLGVPLSIHSDEPVTPIAPLFAMWCAVNRLTHEGRVLGPQERITPEQALHAVTMGPAISLGLDGEIGSLAVGKRADIAVLADDPLSVAPEAIRDIAVWGTVTGGRVFPADG